MRGRFGMLLPLVGLLLVPVLVPALAAERVALVVGNADYNEAAAKLRNPVNDATAVAAALRRLGFQVIEGRDLDEDDFYDKIIEFDDAGREAKMALFYYAGHGLQVDGRNYLAPIDLRLERKQDLSRRAIELTDVLEVMRGETNVVILDACRNNPLAGELARSLGLNRAVAASRGLARVESASGTLIAYATEPGSVAADGTGDHSPYTSALLEHLETPGLSVQDLFTQVTASVLASTGERQKPWTHSSLSKIVRLVPDDQSVATVAAPQPAPTSEPASERLTAEQLATERLFWESVKDSDNPVDLQAYLDRYPGGTYEVLARNRLEALQSSEEPPVAPEEAAESAENRLGLTRAEHRLIQLGLLAAGHDLGKADGLIGAKTRAALRQWQASRGEAVTGYLDVESSKLLLAAGEQAAARQASAEAERLRREQEARQRAQREAEERARREAAEAERLRREREAQEKARQEDEGRTRREAAETAARRPIGSKWFIAKNQSCQVYFPFWEPDDTFTFTWSGDCVDRKATGEGRLVWEHNESGGVYEGRMRSGRLNGQGTMTWANGNRYKGEWREDKPHGKGALTLANGDRFWGQWRDGCYGKRESRWAYANTTLEACGFK